MFNEVKGTTTVVGNKEMCWTILTTSVLKQECREILLKTLEEWRGFYYYNLQHVGCVWGNFD